jgi:predicted metal-dependent phosphoesterase TrpH
MEGIKMTGMADQDNPTGPGRSEMQDTILLDMHVHSCYSIDSALEVEAIVRAWETSGILSLVCDHDSIMGSLSVYSAVRQQNPDIPLILSEEISTRDGEIIGVFLSEEIPPGLCAAETLDRICDQGAIAIVPHPFCTHRSSAIDRRVLSDVIGRIDIVEGYNGRNRSPEANVHARAFARQHDKPVSAGSDAHTSLELSRTYVEISPFEEPKDLLENLRTAKVQFREADPVVHAFSRAIKRARQTTL